MTKSSVQPAEAPRIEDARDPAFDRDLVHRELVARIVLSPTFARSERLSSFLSYVCDVALRGRGREINEQLIGHAVFGRSPNYDSAVDGIVRTQASRLRQRLDLYFQQEGAAEPIRIVIPRGGYVPVFEPRTPYPGNPDPRNPDPKAADPKTPELSTPALTLVRTESPEPSPEPAPASSTGLPPRLKSRALPWALCGLLSLAFAAAVLVNRGVITFSPFGRPPDHPLWSRIFSSERPTLVVPGDSGLVLFHGLAMRNTDLDDYLRGDYRTDPNPSPTTLQAAQTNLANRRYTSIVDLEVASTLAQLSLARRSKFQVRYARDVRPNDLKSGNVVLVGAAEANPWVELFERNMNYVFHNDLKAGVFSVLNRAPLPNEPPQWDSATGDPQHRVYGVVAFLPSFAGDGNTLILEGTSMAGTESAWDFVSDDSQLLPFLNRIRKPDGTLPHFELLLGTNNLSASAVRNTVLSWRIVP